MLKRQQQENDEEELQKSASKKQTFTKASVISTSKSPVRSSQKQANSISSNYSSPSKNHQFLPSFNSTQINNTTPLQSIQSSTNINNTIVVCSPRPYQKSPGLLKSPIKSPIKPFMACHSPSQASIASTFSKKIIDFSSSNLANKSIEAENELTTNSVDDDDCSSLISEQTTENTISSPTKSTIIYNKLENDSITPTKSLICSPIKTFFNSNYQQQQTKSTNSLQTQIKSNAAAAISPVRLFSTVKSSNPIKMISPIKQTGVSTPETLCVSDKKKLFEKAIKEETANAKRVEEQKQFLFRKKFPTSLNQEHAVSLPKKIKTSIFEFENKFNESPKSWTPTTKSEPKILDVEMKQISVNLREQEDDEQIDEQAVEEDEDTYFEEVSQIKNTQLNKELSLRSLHSIKEEEDDNEEKAEEEQNEFENNNKQASNNLYPSLSELNEESSSDYESTSDLKHRKQKSPVKIVKSPQKQRIETPTTLLSTIKQQKDSKPATPLRTLSQYRREQKQRAALYSTPTTKLQLQLDDNQAKEDELTKWQLHREQLREKLINLKTLVEKYDKIIVQSSNAITICLKTSEQRGSSYQIEAEKILMITTQKRIACLQEIDLIKTKINSSDHKVPSCSIANGCITFAKIQIPLKGDFIVGQISDQDPLNHHFICVARCGEIVLESELLSSADSIQDASITFTQNKMQFSGLDMEFEIQFEVYGLALPKEKAHNHYHHDKKTSSIIKHSIMAPLSPKLSRSKKAAAAAAAASNQLSYCANDGFTRLGFIKINKDNLLDKKFEFNDFLYNSPFNGQAQIDFKLNADYNVELRDYLNFYDESGEYSVWNRRWCVLKGYLLAYWRFREDETIKPSMGVIDLRKCVNKKFSQVNYEMCARSNTFMLVTLKEIQDQDLTEKQLRNKQAIDKNKIHKTLAVEKILISTDMDIDMKIWCSNLNKLLPLIRVWEEDATPILDTY